MLTIPNLADVRARDPRLYEALMALVKAVQENTAATGAGPGGAVAPPPRLASFTVSSASGYFDVAIIDQPAKLRTGIAYFVESDSNPSFPNPTTYFLGPVRSQRLALGGVTLYWRAYSQYPNSAISPIVTFGNPPQAVAGGGTATAPPPAGGGSGSGSGGGSGYGGGGQGQLK